MRKLLLLFAALLLVPASAQAQADFETYATEAELIDGTPLNDVNVLGFDRLPTGAFVFYNGSSGDLATYDPTTGTTTFIRSDDDIDADVGADVTTIDALTTDTAGNIYLAVRAESVNYVYKTDVTGSTGTVLATADATTGLALDPTQTTLYIAGNQFNGGDASDPDDNLDDGFYSVSTTGTDQTVNDVLVNTNLDLADLGVGTDGTIYATSSKFGETDALTNVIVSVTDPQSSPALNTVADPFAEGVFTNGQDGGIEDIEVFNFLGTDHLYVFNNSFTASTGEQFGFFDTDGSDGQQFANESDITGDGDVNAGGLGGGNAKSLYFDETTNDLLFASIDVFDDADADEVIRIFDQPLPVEFDGAPQATVRGHDVTLAWTTLSETNNAGFYVQHRRAGQSGWTDANDALIEGAGTATSAHTYRHTIEGMVPGRYTFRVQQVDINDGESFSPTVEVNVSAAGFALQPPTQNPLQGGRTTLSYSAPEGSDMQAVLYNSLGQQVRRLDAQNGRIAVEAGGLASGLYFVRLISEDGRSEVQSLTLVR